jgi:hypothetical protein
MEENLSEQELIRKIASKCNVFPKNKTITSSVELTKEDEFYLLELKRRFKYLTQYEIKFISQNDITSYKDLSRDNIKELVALLEAAERNNSDKINFLGRTISVEYAHLLNACVELDENEKPST